MNSNNISLQYYRIRFCHINGERKKERENDGLRACFVFCVSQVDLVRWVYI